MADGKKTVLFDRHLAQGGKIIPFSGFLLPTHYSSINQEHLAVRERAGLFDVSHMGEFYVSGSGAESFLQKMTVNDVSALSSGQAQYSAMCYKNGNIVDDLLIYNKQDSYLLVVNAANLEKDLKWLKSHIEEENVSIADTSGETGLLALQGPRSRDILQQLTASNLKNIPYYHFYEGKVVGNEAVIARTGYTGELGFEIYSANEDLAEIWDEIMAAGEVHGIVPAGLGCRDTLRMEMKYTLYGNDIDETTNPIEAGLGWITKLDKDKFIGKEALLAAKTNRSRRLVCFEMTERAIPRNGCSILIGDEFVGYVTSGTMSPSLGEGIGIGYVELPYDKSGTEFIIDIRGKHKPAVVVKPPFYKKGSLMD